MIDARNAILTTRPTGAAGRSVRFIPRRRHRPGSRSCDAVRLCGDAADSRAVGQHEPLQPEKRGLPRCRRPFFRGRARRRFRPEQDSAADRHAFGRQTDGRRATDAVGGAHKGRCRGRPGVSPRYRETERYRRSGRAHAQRAHGPDRSERSDHPRGTARQSPVAHGEPRWQELAGQESACAEHCQRTIRRTVPADPVIRADVAGFRKLLAEWPTTKL